MSQLNSRSEEVDNDNYQLLNILFDNCEYGIIVVDVNMVIVLCNDWVSGKSGVESQTAVGRQLLSVFPELKKSRMISLINDAINKGASGMLSHALNKAPFPFYDPLDTTIKIKHAIYVKPVNLSEHVRYCAIQIVDVTAALRRERQLSDLAEKAQQAKIEAEKLSNMKSGFISTVSHELRTPLTSIRGSLGLITGGAVGEIPDQAVPLVEIAKKNTDRLLILINDILDMEKIESGKLDFNYKPVDVMTFLDSAKEANAGYAEQHGVSLRISVEEDDARIYADSDRLMQVMNNLISNAAKFAPKGSVVEIASIRHGGEIRISVTDHGPGIPKEFQEQLFEKFTQADSSSTRIKGGTGLGMSICKAIVEKHGGELKYITEEDIGTTFYFDLIEWTDTSRAALINNKPDKLDINDKHVLICEDDIDVALVLRLMMESHGYTADVANDAKQAITMLQTKHYDAMTMDIQLPGRSGYSLYKELRENPQTAGLPIIVVSAEVDEAKQELAGGAAGIVDWLYKPLDQGRLISAIKRASKENDSSLPKVLHVEDDPSISNFIKELLEDKVKISNCSTLKEAKIHLDNNIFDMVLLDVGLPDGSGLDLLGYIQKTSPSTLAIIFSSQDINKETSLQIKSALFDEKVESEALIESIESLMH